MGNKTMDALVKEKRGPGLKLMRVPVPSPRIGEVLIKVSKAAICGTDVHIYNWDAWSQQRIDPPVVIGHEYVGEIVALGDGVTGLHIGQRVSSESHVVCGRCRNCLAGNEQWCENTTIVGVNLNGAFAEYLCVPDVNVMPLPDDIPEDVASFYDALGNATHTALMFDVRGENVLITGAGPIGLMAAKISKFCGARSVVITDVKDYRLDLARSMGVDAAVNVSREGLENAMRKVNIEGGFDIGMEMSGNPAGLAQLLKALRNGGKAALLGIFSSGPSDTDWNDIIFKGLTVQGITGRRTDNWHQMSALIQGGLDMLPVVTHRYHYTDFEKGFSAMKSGESGKVVFDWTEK